MRVFVKNKRGESLDTTDSRTARILLKNKKAKIINYKPFMIQMVIPTGETTLKRPQVAAAFKRAEECVAKKKAA